MTYTRQSSTQEAASARSLGDHESSHRPLHIRDAVACIADDTGAERGVSHTERSAEHSLARVADPWRAVFWLRSKDCGVHSGWVFDVSERGRDEGVEGGVRRDVRERRGWVAGSRAHVCGAIGVTGVVVAKGMTDGDGAAVRDGVADVVSASIAVVLARVHGLDDGLRIGPVVGLDDSGVCRRRRGENGGRICQCMEISPLS